jgi:NACalpha-BTF3-like transcription factor
MTKKLKWEDLKDKPWNIINVAWELFETFFQIFGSVKKKNYQNVYNKLDDEKKKKVIKLICMVRGQKIEEEKEVEDFEISIDDIELVLERAKKVRPQLFVENVNG